MAKQIIIVVHTAPKTHPGGVQGAAFKFVNQFDCVPAPVKRPPSANPTKLMTRNRMIRKAIMWFKLKQMFDKMGQD